MLSAAMRNVSGASLSRVRVLADSWKSFVWQRTGVQSSQLRVLILILWNIRPFKIKAKQPRNLFGHYLDCSPSISCLIDSFWKGEKSKKSSRIRHAPVTRRRPRAATDFIIKKYFSLIWLTNFSLCLSISLSRHKTVLLLDLLATRSQVELNVNITYRFSRRRRGPTWPSTINACQNISQRGNINFLSFYFTVPIYMLLAKAIRPRVSLARILETVFFFSFTS